MEVEGRIDIFFQIDCRKVGRLQRKGDGRQTLSKMETDARLKPWTYSDKRSW